MRLAKLASTLARAAFDHIGDALLGDKLRVSDPAHGMPC